MTRTDQAKSEGVVVEEQLRMMTENAKSLSVALMKAEAENVRLRAEIKRLSQEGVKMKLWIVMSEVSGGMTGYRCAPLRRDGTVQVFCSEQEARETVENLSRTMGRNSAARFRYWVERADAGSLALA